MSRPGALTLREARDSTGLSRETVAAKVGISSKTLERMEKSDKAKRHVVEDLAAVYGMSVRRIRFKPQPARNGKAAA